ncbi:flagellar biosynthetic protein FliO [Pseudoxanthomonas wuyuanensis]|uniref:Flagellar protein n=1 Tax=Pseudoxanthomonas wuyuanensis TaxID=1073196 RepID=A0A286D040_9GAMM|nr:flagellar biosynthetic protein FliO [Pseudoxanthomonas wuyuanensis]SOD51986.1 flagellar protein FliO/FliZ [Pseudoxanthomonas wuyuanensis]
MLAAFATAAAPVQKIGYAAPSTPGIGGAFVALILVLGLILGLAWLLKRMPGSGLGLRQNDQLRVVTTLAVGGKERLMVIEIGGEQLLIGVAAGGIHTLHRLPEPLPAQPAPQLPNFAELLAKRLRKET